MEVDLFIMFFSGYIMIPKYLYGLLGAKAEVNTLAGLVFFVCLSRSAPDSSALPGNKQTPLRVSAISSTHGPNFLSSVATVLTFMFVY